ncbi:MAG: helix-turn-helix domain-containing protein [Clostridiales bacterium]|jgi:hypothetical protein|nr:helix-turn-helix domain-containing protein [Clostridiales bacterium]
MNTNSTKKNLHLTLEERIEIQECLSHDMSFKAIGKHISKDPTTVSKEVKKHISILPTTLKRTDKDGLPVVALCPLLLKPPFLCNPCPKAHSACGFDRHFYRAKQANTEYENLLSEAREGVMLTKQEFFDSDAIISQGIKNGQHLYHIAKTSRLSMSIPTVYRHLKNGLLSVAPIGFPRVIKFRGRTEKHADYVPVGLKIGRNYMDFQLFCENLSIDSWVEMDTVIGILALPERI